MKNQVEYWLGLCDDDLLTARWLLEGGRLLHCGYFCHQIAEKSLKAVISSVTQTIPPKIHDLQKLAVHGGVFDSFSDEQLAMIDKLTPLQIEARYPEYKERIAATLTGEYCKELLSETEGFLCWIKQRLEK
jgi:HEPN domain-containing protein